MSTLNKMRRFAIAMLLATLWPVTLPAQSVVTLDQARGIARQALTKQSPEIALEIGKTLLSANPRDADALLIIAAAQAQLGNPINGRRAAARAYRYSAIPAQKFDAAQIAAGLAARTNRLTLAQVWLRRASQHTDAPEAQASLARTFRTVRAQNPWRFNLQTSLRPSSNVNNGANSAEQTVEGINIAEFGTLSASAQALSGVIAQTTLDVGYRLRGDARSRTELATRIRVRRVDLSTEARRKANTARQDAIAAGFPAHLIPADPKNRDFGSTYADLTLRHRWQIGGTRGSTAMVSTGIGTFWYGTQEQARLARIDASRTWPLASARQFTFFGSVMRRDEVGSSRSDSMTYAVLGSYAQKLNSGAQWSLGLSLSDTVSDQTNLDSSTWSLRSRYRFPRAWGPAQASAGISVSRADYSAYALTSALFVPGGRQDTAAYADLTLFFAEYDYLGFAPEVTIRAGQKSSNVSRFETEEVSVSLGLQSKF